MKIFVADDRFDIGVIDVGRDPRVGEHELGIEDVQSLVFHRAHVEVADRDDHEPVEVEFETEALFIPADAVLERHHCMLGLVEVAGFDPHLEQDFAPGAQRVPLFLAHQLAGHQREQVGRFLERIFPFGEVAAIAQIPLLDQVTVRQ